MIEACKNLIFTQLEAQLDQKLGCGELLKLPGTTGMLSCVTYQAVNSDPWKARFSGVVSF